VCWVVKRGVLNATRRHRKLATVTVTVAVRAHAFFFLQQLIAHPS
jgi:hypothetical protein